VLRSRIPRYHRIAEYLRERIVSGALRTGARLPNQRRLAAEFGVTLMTLRQALAVLERERLIVRQHGLGTFVASPSIDYDILQLQRLAGDLSAQGEAVHTRFVTARFTPAEAGVARALALDDRARVFLLERLRFVGGHPMSLQRSFLPAAMGAEVAKADLTITPLRQVLEFKLGLTITSASETISAIRLGRREARELGCRSGQPAFLSERVSFAPERTAVVFDRAYIPGDRFRITRRLSYDTNASDTNASAPHAPVHHLALHQFPLDQFPLHQFNEVTAP
jgi:GntR family transcriptional regulator